MSEAEIRAIPGGWAFIWMHENVRLRMTRFVTERRSHTESCEALVESISPAISGHLHQSRVTLTSTISKQQLVKALYAIDANTLWAPMVEFACVKALILSRQGEPMVEVGLNPSPDATRYRLKPLLVEGEANMIYGDGGTFKSYLGLFISLLVQSGQPALGFPVMQGNVLYLDWETTDTTANARLRALCRGLERAPFSLHYRRCYSTLADDVEALQQMVYEAKISLVIVDSVAGAAGEELKEAESAAHMYNALRSLGCTTLLIHHVPRPLPGQTSSNPYGSVYFRNYTRNAWEIRKGEQTIDGSFSLGLFNRKNNDGRLQQDIGLDIRFETGANDITTCVSISRGNVKINSEAQKAKGQAVQIRELLLMGGLTDDALSSALGIPKDSVQSRLSDMRKAGIAEKDEDDVWTLIPGVA